MADLENNNLRLPHSAYFYKITKKISKRDILNLFRSIREKKDNPGNNVIQSVREKGIGDALISTLCFPFYESVDFLNCDGYNEHKYAYICIVEIDDYLIISKKHTNLSNTFSKKIEELSYEKLSYCFVNDDTKFEKINTVNLSSSQNVIKHKSLTANSLNDCLSPVGNNTHAIRAMRIADNNCTRNISLTTSRITERTSENSFDAFINWCSQMKLCIETSKLEECIFLNNFARATPYKQGEIKSEMIGIEILWDMIKMDIDSHKIKAITYNTKIINIERFKKFITGISTLHTYESKGFKISNKHYIKTIPSSSKISIDSSLFNKIHLIFDEIPSNNGFIDNINSHDIITLKSYINKHQLFIIYYKKHNIIYYNKVKYEDNKLLENIESFKSLFISKLKLNNTVSEKGDFNESSKHFSENSIFHFVEEDLAKHFSYLICDDLGNEFADHIGICESKVAFYVSKFAQPSNSNDVSVSKLHDAIAQAQKNIPLLKASNDILEKKSDIWKKFYRETQIPRLRRGSSVENAIKKWQSNISTLGASFELNIVINCVTKRKMCDLLDKCKDNTISLTKQARILQLIWLISSLYSTCLEQGISFRIYCSE